MAHPLKPGELHVTACYTDGGEASTHKRLWDVESHSEGFVAERCTLDHAHLFAAAPDLLEAANMALWCAERMASTNPTQPAGHARKMQAQKVLQKLRAAIEKARAPR